VGPACGFSSAEKELSRGQVLVCAGASVGVTGSVTPSDRVTGYLTELISQVAAGRQQRPEVVQADLTGGAVAVPVSVAHTGSLSQHDAACSTRPVAKRTPEPSGAQLN